MIRFVFGKDEQVATAVVQMVPGHEHGFGKCTAIGIIDDDGALIAGVVFHNWSPQNGTIELSAAALPGKRWLTRTTIRQMYEYAFDTCGCQMVISVVSERNERVLRQFAAGGYTFVRLSRHYGRDHDAIYCTLTEEDWRKNKFNKPPLAEAREAA
jgi:RimJ/RimL family protein N-acetyltransferase